MFEYLTNYGLKRTNINYDDIDINDRLCLQDQINESRKVYYELLDLLDKVQEKHLECTKKMSKRSKELLAENNNVRNNYLFSTDDEFITLEAEQQALKAGMNMINAQIDFCKNDLRILNSVFYNKF